MPASPPEQHEHTGDDDPEVQSHISAMDPGCGQKVVQSQKNGSGRSHPREQSQKKKDTDHGLSEDDKAGKELGMSAHCFESWLVNIQGPILRELLDGLLELGGESPG